MPFPKIFLLMIFAMGCGFADAASAQDNQYVFIVGARGNPYWTALSDGIKDEAKQKNMDAIVYELDNDTDAEGQLNICQTAIQRKPKLIAMEAINSAIGLACFKQAAAAGIMVADIDNHLTIDDAAKAGINLAYMVGSDNVKIGHTAAEYVAGAVKKPNAKILIIEGAPGSVPGEKRADGFRQGIKELMPSATIVASISANWDRLKAMTIASDNLQRQPDIDVIYSVNDVMALGVVEGVRNAGESSTVKTIGVDGTADARKAIADGHMTATVAQLPYLIGQKAVDLSLEAVQGQKFNPVEVTPTPVLTAAKLKSGTDPLLQYVR